MITHYFIINMIPEYMSRYLVLGMEFVLGFILGRI